MALHFLNSYIDTKNDLELLEFVKVSPLATENLTTELEKIVINVREAHPEFGLDFDPFDAQDYPSEGVELFEFDPKIGYVMVKGIDWNNFRVVMRVVNKNGHLLVDGCGALNILESKRAPR